MTCSLDRHLAVAVDPARPPSLISEAQLANLHAIARLLPSALTEFFGFECRLGDPDPRADFLLCAKASEGGREVLAGQRAGARLSESLAADPIWQRIERFAALWADPRSPIYGKVENVWLEFDMERAVARPAPSIFLGTQALRHPAVNAADAVTPTAATAPEDDHAWFFDAVLVALTGPEAARRLEPALRRALAALPPGAQIFQVGAMLARDADTIRICVRGLSHPEAAALVRAVGWPGPLAEIDAVIADAFARADSVDVDFDIGTDVGPKIGLECSFLPTPPSQLRQRAFLEHLVDTHLCTPAKRQGLLEWPRGFHERANADGWPHDLRQRSAALGGTTLSAFVRWLYHVKLVYEPGHPLHAKAYLAVRQFWPTAQMIKAMVAATGQA